MSYYQLFELQHAALAPARAAADMARLYVSSPFNPISNTSVGRGISAGLELFERVTRRYGKPEFGLATTTIDGKQIAVREKVVWEKPFCRLIHFERAVDRRKDPTLLIVAPLSGHYATLLRGTVEAFLPNHEVYITDWVDARMVPLSLGTFDLHDYVDYVIEMVRLLSPDCHVVAVCQPAVPVFAATAIMERANDPDHPASITLMGGPIDTRVNPTAVNRFAMDHGIEWFRRNTIMPVPFPHPGFMRPVYPGFLQLTGFMAMNFNRHVTAHREFYQHLIIGDGDSAEKHRVFYDEYLSVMDMTAEFYLQTVEKGFIRHELPKGELVHRGIPVDPADIRRVPLMTVEGERDDISGVGQTEAAHALTVNLPAHMKRHHLQKGVGHYGVFNGAKFRAEIAPRIAEFIRAPIRKGHGRAARN